MMELKVFRDTLSAAGSFCTVKSEIPVETEILISDYLPQVFKIVKCFAKLVVLQKQLQAGRLSLDGYLRCVVYYQGENGQGLCQTEQKIPFTKALELPSLEFSSWSAVVGGETEYLNCRAVNQRRVEVRGAYEISAGVYTQLQQEVITAVSDCGVQQKQAALHGVRCLASLDKLITADNEFTFEQTPGAILDITGTATVRELKIISGKAVVKGEIGALAAYRTDPDGTLRAQRVPVPFNQILDIEGLTEDCRCLCVVEPVGFTVSDSGEEQAASRMSASALLHLRAFRDYEIELVTDVFSTHFETDVQQSDAVAEQLEKQLDETVTVQTSGQMPDEAAVLVACFASFGAAEIVPMEEKAVLRARGVVTALCRNSLQEIESYERPVELNLPLGPAEKSELLHAECWLSAEDVSCSVSNGTLEASVTVRVQGLVLGRCAMKAAAAVTLGEALTSADPEISLRIYYAHAGEELFEIARRFHVSPREMLSVNDLEEETLSEPRRLLVPSVG